ncbi:MAG: PKD domain-containing protein [Bacteroidia bacterium]|nr:PKD domain-containing protein [Bacteroidia bacterium]
MSTIRGTHIVGGELNYRHLGGNSYEITLVVYRDCYGGQAQFDDPAAIGVFDAQLNLVANSMVYITNQHRIANGINTPCLTAPNNICYEVARYTYTTTLPPSPGGYQLVYQRCCRNHSVLNINNVQFTGATYLASIPDPGLAAINSNPVFNQLPPTFICEDAPFSFDHSASDFDGDSIVYEICIPLDGGDQSNPMPQPPNSPPYNNIQWQNPFSLNNVFGGDPLRIDPRTGRLTATPLNSGQYVYGVCAKEYRNGVYLGETKRDFQVNVVPCPMITVASIFSPTIVCGSLTAEFANNSYNALSYKWNFGDVSTSNDTSSLKNPSWTYPDTGVYMAELIAYSGSNALCNDTAKGIVRIYPEFFTDYSFDNVRCSPEFSFIDGSFGLGGTSNYWEWDFGDSAKSSDANPVHTYQMPGIYDVRLITSTDSSCLDTMMQTISVLQRPEANFNLNFDTCQLEVQTFNQSLFAEQSVWNFGNTWSAPVAQPLQKYLVPGIYNIRLVAITDSLCTDTSSMLIDVPALPQANFSYDVDECDSLVRFTNLSLHATTYEWEFGDGVESTGSSPEHIYTLAGHIPVRLISTSAHSCSDTLEQEIFFVSYKEASFSTALDSCSGYVHFNGVTENAVSYFWDFGDGNTSTSATPIHAYSENGTYEVLLTVNNKSSCTDSVRLNTIYEGPLGEMLFVPNSFTPNGDGLNDVFRISVFRPCEKYSITIFNRWGQVVFEEENAVDAIWDGTFKNSMAEEGVYVYLLKSENQSKKGVAYLTR